MFEFWIVNDRGEVTIDLSLLQQFLEYKGFYVMYLDKENYSYFYVKQNIIEGKATKPQIIQKCLAHIEEFAQDENKENVKTAFLKKVSILKNGFLDALKPIKINPLRDDKHHSYIPFKNGIDEVSKDNIQIRSYSDFPNNHFWREHIIDFNFQVKDKNEIVDKSEFYKFLVDITHIKGHPKESQTRLEGLMTILGYLLHTYKDPANARAIILMDADHFNAENGGTGKGILTQALGKVRSLSKEDGKSLNTGNRFNWSRVQEHTNIIAVEDIPRNFNFKSLFSAITDGMTVERKYENKFYIPFERSPKIMLSSNYEVSGTGSSFKRRKVEFELSNYYDENFGPEDKYGHLFFLQWDSQQWLLFYNLMAWSIQEYLEKGIVETNSIVLWYPKLKNSTCEEFADFADENFDLDVRYNKKEMYKAFIEAYPDFKNMEQRTFTFWIKQYAAVRGYKFKDSHSDTERYFELNRDEAFHTQEIIDTPVQN